MFKQLLRLTCLFALVASTTVCMSAQDADAKPAKSAKAGKGSTTVTGCIQKGTEANGYYITDENGKTWELSPSSKVSEHAGHKVTLTGMTTKAPKATEAKKESHEKEEAGSNSHAGDFKVSTVKMISETCSQ
jgi:hypothetical protein